MFHKFKLGQRVRINPRFSFSTPSMDATGVYEVIRLMPADETGEPGYRIKSGASERAVRQSEIAPAV